MRIRLLLALALGAILCGVGGNARPAAAHPLGNFTTNQYVRIEVLPEAVRLIYILDLAEIPAFQEIGERIDADGDDTVSAAEETVYLDAKLAEIISGLHLSVDGADLPLTATDRTLTLPEGQAGLQLVRLRAVLAAPLGLGDGQAVAFDLDYETDRPGWREVVVTHASDVALTGSDAPLQDVSSELQRYPDDLLSSPLDQTSARFTAISSPGAVAAVGYGMTASVDDGSAPAQSGRPGGGNSGDRFAALLDGDDLTATGLFITLGLAFVWGAAHALSPGHGKTVVGAYLVGSRGTPRHALFLGLTVTVTHTAGVIALGLVTLLLSHYILPDQLYPWMSLTSGLLVLGMGLLLLRARFGHGHGHFGHHHHGDHSHDHEHDHSHEYEAHHHDHHHDLVHDHVHSHGHGHSHSHLPPASDGDKIRWRSLLALGVSGGLVPCPSALVVLLGAIALGRVGFGLLLVAVFSLGLAGALTGVGVLFLYARRFLERRTGDGQPGLIPGLTRQVIRYAPMASALGVTIAGAVIVLRALGETSLT